MSIIDKKTKAIVQNQKNGGGGGEPAQYLKTIAKDDVNKKITITDKVGNETEFGYGGSKNSYASITPIREYAHQAIYTDIDYAGAYEFFEPMKPTPNAKVDYKPQGLLKSPIGACSAFYAAGIMGRCYDWNFNEQESIEVKTPAMNGRKDVVGTGYNGELIKSVVESGEYNKAFDYVPFELVDGMNEDGFSIAMLVVPNDIAATTGTTPSGEVEAEVATIMLPRYLLDRCSTIAEAMALLETSVSVYNVMPLIMMGYEVHFFVADATGNHGVIEFINNTPVFTYANAATNFYIHGVQFNDDGTVYTPATQDSEHDAKITNQITDYGSGLERYNLIIETLRNAKDPEVIEQLLYELRFTKAYDRDTTPFRYTEFVGNDYKVNTPPATYDAEGGIVERAIAEFGRRDRATGTTWQTVHGGMFDIENKEIYLVFQEDMTEIFGFSFDYYTARQVDNKLASIGQGNIKYNEPQSLADSEFNQVMENLKLGARIDSTGTMETIYDEQGIDIEYNNFTYTIPNASVRAFNSEKEYEVPLSFGSMGTINVAGKYKTDTLLILKSEMAGVYFQSLEVIGTDIIVSVKSELAEIPHLTGIQINEMTIERYVTPINEEFIPHDNGKVDKTTRFSTTTDINTVVESGIYYSSNWSNIPSGASAFGHLEVFSAGDDGQGDVRILQLYSTGSRNKTDIWVRKHSETSWGSWVKLANAEDLANKVDKLGAGSISRIIVFNIAGEPFEQGMDENPNPTTVPRRNNKGQITATNATADNQLVPKGQMDTELAEIRQKMAGYNKGYVINAESQITGEKQSTGEITNVTAIGEVDLTQVIVGDDVFIKEKSVPDYWVSQITPTNLSNTKWILNDVIDVTLLEEITSHKEMGISINFTSDSVAYDIFGYSPVRDALLYGKLSTFSMLECYTKRSGWIDDIYRTIEITDGEDATDDEFINWLIDNAVLLTPRLTLTPYETKLDLSNFYNIPQTDNLLAGKIDKPTTPANTSVLVMDNTDLFRLIQLTRNATYDSIPVRTTHNNFEVGDAVTDTEVLPKGQADSTYVAQSNEVPFLLEYADGTSETLNMIAESTSNDNAVDEVDNQGGELDG